MKTLLSPKYLKVLFFGALLIVAALLLMEHQNRSPVQKFWSWFEQNQTFYYSYSNKDYSEENAQRLNDLQTELKKIDPGLSYELLPVEDDGRRGIAITPNHTSELMILTDSVVAHAPKLSQWHVYAYKQRKDEVSVYNQTRNIHMDADNVFFTYSTSTQFDITLYIDEYIPSEASKTMYQYLLDNVVGEYAAMQDIWVVDAKPLSQAPKNTKLFPILHLRTIIDEAGPCGAIPKEYCKE